MSAPQSQSGLVLELAEEFLTRYRKGERPALQEYVDRHPELAAAIREVFPAMALMENIALSDDARTDQTYAAAALQQLSRATGGQWQLSHLRLRWLPVPTVSAAGASFRPPVSESPPAGLDTLRCHSGARASARTRNPEIMGSRFRRVRCCASRPCDPHHLKIAQPHSLGRPPSGKP